MTPRIKDGVRPWRTQAQLPEGEVTLWEIDSAGTFDREGKPLPRLRLQVKGSRAKATAVRRSWLLELEGNPPPKRKPPRKANAGPQPASGETTLATLVEGGYHDWSRQQHRAVTTAVRMQNLRRYVLPVLGSLPIQECNLPRSINKLRKALEARGTLMASTQGQVLLCLSNVLTWASNPDRHDDGVALIGRKIRIQLPKDDRASPGAEIYHIDKFVVGHARHKRLTDEQWRAVLGTCKDDDDTVLVGLGLLAGCRISEAGARKWTDVDFVKQRIHIYSEVCSQTRRIVPTKNGQAGWVPLPKALGEALARLKTKARSEWIIDPPRREYDPKCKKQVSKAPLVAKAISWRYARIGERAGLLRPGNYHALRHTYCSRLADAGLPVQTIKKLARHKNIATTFGYVAANEAELQSAGALIDV